MLPPTAQYRLLPAIVRPAPPQTALPMADVLATGQGYTIRIHAVADPADAGSYNQPRAGFRQIAFDVTVTNTGSAALGNNAGAFQVVASDGPGHRMFSRGVEPRLEATGLGPSASARGWVTFPVDTFAVLTGLTYTRLAATSSVTFALR